MPATDESAYSFETISVLRVGSARFVILLLFIDTDAEGLVTLFRGVVFT